jgi:hypothetical protein
MFLVAVVIVPHGFAQLAERSSEGYIEKLFEGQVGQLPRMGWFGSPQGFVAQADADEVYLFAPIGMPLTGRKRGPVSTNDLKFLQQRFTLACEMNNTDHLTAFDVGGDTEPERGLYITKKMQGEVRSGLVTIPLDGMQMARVNRLLGWPNQGTLRRDEAIGVRSPSFFYSFHKLYNAKTGLLSQEALVLHKRDGAILAHELTRDLDSGQSCDSCGIPSFLYRASGTYRPLNTFELPGFTYPVLLLDTSTVEGRALSLLTFTPDGKVTQFRVYEYVVHCG